MERLNESTVKNKFFEWFREVLHGEIGDLPTNSYDVRFRLKSPLDPKKGGWRTKHLNAETYEELLRNAQDNNLTVPEGENHHLASGKDEENDILLIDSLEIVRNNNYNVIGAMLDNEYINPENENYGQQYRRIRGGADFNYSYVGDKADVREYLKRLEVGVNNKSLSCFVYALKMTGKLPDDTLTKINLRCNNKFLKISHIQKIRKEFNLNLELIYYTDEGGEKVIIKGEKGHALISLCLWLNHYFINELTPFKHCDFDPGMSPKRPNIKSPNLLKYLMKRNELKPLTVANGPTSNLEFNDLPNDLSINPQYCIKPWNYLKSDLTF
jgi:hypothetical protein